jgi:hypothetical protein
LDSYGDLFCHTEKTILAIFRLDHRASPLTENQQFEAAGLFGVLRNGGYLEIILL